MKRPLWQVFLHILLVAFSAHRGALAIVFYLEQADPLLWLGFGAQSLAGFVASFGVLLGKRWSPHVVLLTAVAIATTALYGAFGNGTFLSLAAISQVLLAGLGATALAVALRHEFSE